MTEKQIESSALLPADEVAINSLPLFYAVYVLSVEFSYLFLAVATVFGMAAVYNTVFREALLEEVKQKDLTAEKVVKMFLHGKSMLLLLATLHLLTGASLIAHALFFATKTLPILTIIFGYFLGIFGLFVRMKYLPRMRLSMQKIEQAVNNQLVPHQNIPLTKQRHRQKTHRNAHHPRTQMRLLPSRNRKRKRTNKTGRMVHNT